MITMEPSITNVPKHIGIIMDGNRRFAKRLMLKPWKGHEYGAKKLKKVLEWCEEIGCHELTLYAFSLENFNRPKEEFKYLMDTFRTEFDNIIDNEQDIIHKKKMRINFIGRIWMFPKDVYEKMKKLMDITKDYSDNQVNIAMAYSGREEIIDAAKKIAEMVKQGKLNIDDINKEVFEKNLYMSAEPDLIIRTSGERRTSGFLLFQSDYAEFFFCEKMWPEFEKEDFISAVQDYSNRNRRRGR